MSETPGTDLAARLIARWLDESQERAAGPEGTAQDRGAAALARRAWEDGGRFTPEAVRELADWADARVEDPATGANPDSPGDGGRLTVADKEAVHRWIEEQEYRL
ncbi:hypothetical protein [Wenjunlia tyrosinilytica]|nr:hypothetical protein [Wenjunlia tyrosinilytica]